MSFSKMLLNPAIISLYAEMAPKLFHHIDSIDFDLVITDLKLPDISGIEVLSYAKGKDEYTEVIVITGYASLDSATLAINLGVNSYLIKPLAITDLLIQVEKAVASRLFHLKSIRYMQQFDTMAPDDKEHLFDITSLYFFIRKLMLSLEISEIMRITLEEANQKMGSVLSILSVKLFGYSEIFAMPSAGSAHSGQVTEVVRKNFTKVFPLIELEEFDGGDVSVMVYNGKQGDSPDLGSLYPFSVPMMVTDRTIGTLTVFYTDPAQINSDQNQFFYVFSSVVSSVVEHGYSSLQARQQAKTDSLTGIANHRLFHETLEREIARANRRKGNFSLILLDIDNFKKINDTWGHQVGDAVIIDLTRRISGMVRVCDLFARYGGEEFALVLPDTDLEGAHILGSRILQAISSTPLISSHHTIDYTVSLGLAVFEQGSNINKDKLIAVADSAMYASKRNGKNQLSIGSI